MGKPGLVNLIDFNICIASLLYPSLLSKSDWAIPVCGEFSLHNLKPKEYPKEGSKCIFENRPYWSKAPLKMDQT
jgi:hypothetical protein